MRAPQSIVRRLLPLAAANALAPILQLVASPLVLRLYAPDIFGQYALQYGVAMLVSMVLGGFLYQGMVSEESRSRVDDLYWQSIVLTILPAMLVGIPAATVAYAYGGQECAFAVLTLGALLTFNQIQTFFLARTDRTAWISRALVAKAVVMVSAQLVLGAGTATVESLLAAAGISELLFAIFTLWVLRGDYPELRSLKGALTLRGAKSHRDFPLKFLPSQLTSFAVNLMPMAVLNAIGASHVAGYFAFAFRLTQAPASALTNAIRAVYWRFFVTEGRSPTATTRSMLLRGHAVALCGAACLIVLPESVLSYFFGKEWSGLSSVLGFVFLWTAASVLTQIPMELVKHSNQQGLVLRVELLGAAIKVACAAVLYTSTRPDVAVKIFCMACYAFNLIAAAIYVSSAKSAQPA